VPHPDVPSFLGLLVIILVAAKAGAALAKFVGQPAVLGELIAGVVLGQSVLGLLDPGQETLHLLAELGVVILLFEIGLETDLAELLRVGGTSAAVAVTGVVLPFSVGYAACRLLGQPELVSVVAGAALTATSVGITARVLADLGRLRDPEGQVVLGAAVIDDVIGLVILTVVTGVTRGREPTVASVGQATALAFGFLVVALALGPWLVAPLVRAARRADPSGVPLVLALVLAFGLAWAAAWVGSAPIIGAFAAGLLLRQSGHVAEIERAVTPLGRFLVPLFFATVGAAVDVRVLNPLDPANQSTLALGGLPIVVAILSKFAAGYAPVWFKGRKSVIGAGMIPRGEVGLIFAQMGLANGVFDSGQYSAVMLRVMATTFLAPPLLRWLLSPGATVAAADVDGVADLVAKG
jgi:Kef-type K+ transport system membrane component KefB